MQWEDWKATLRILEAHLAYERRLGYGSIARLRKTTATVDPEGKGITREAIRRHRDGYNVAPRTRALIAQALQQLGYLCILYRLLICKDLRA